MMPSLRDFPRTAAGGIGCEVCAGAGLEAAAVFYAANPAPETANRPYILVCANHAPRHHCAAADAKIETARAETAGALGKLEAAAPHHRVGYAAVAELAIDTAVAVWHTAPLCRWQLAAAPETAGAAARAWPARCADCGMMAMMMPAIIVGSAFPTAGCLFRGNAGRPLECDCESESGARHLGVVLLTPPPDDGDGDDGYTLEDAMADADGDPYAPDSLRPPSYWAGTSYTPGA